MTTVLTKFTGYLILKPLQSLKHIFLSICSKQINLKNNCLKMGKNEVLQLIIIKWRPFEFFKKNVPWVRPVKLQIGFTAK